MAVAVIIVVAALAVRKACESVARRSQFPAIAITLRVMRGVRCLGTGSGMSGEVERTIVVQSVLRLHFFRRFFREILQTFEALLVRGEKLLVSGDRNRDAAIGIPNLVVIEDKWIGEGSYIFGDKRPFTRGGPGVYRCGLCEVLYVVQAADIEVLSAQEIQRLVHSRDHTTV